MAMTYKGTYRIKNPGKYSGDPTKVVFRSYWERQTFRFLDENPNVIKWNSEETVVPYMSEVDGKVHRYFPDLKVTFATGKTYIIEIKPFKETQEPKVPAKKTKRFINEALTYIKNQSKWKAAREWCKENGCEFVVWTERELQGLGIQLLLNK